MMKVLKCDIKMILKGFRLLFRIEKTFVLFLIITSIISAIIPYINVVMLARIINELVTDANSTSLIVLILITVMANFILLSMNAGFSHIRNYHLDQFFKNEQMLFSKKSMDIDYPTIELQETSLLRTQINIESQTGYNTYHIHSALAQIISHFISIISSISLTMSLFTTSNLSPWVRITIGILILLVIVIAYMSSQKVNTLQEKMYTEFVPYNAIYDFYNDYLKNYNTGKDIRIYGLSSVIAEGQKNLDESTYEIERKTILRTLVYRLINTAASTTLSVVVYIFVAVASLAGNLLVGNISQYVICLVFLVSASSGLIVQMQSLRFNNRYLERYFKYLDMPSTMDDNGQPVSQSVHEFRFHNVSYKYPNSDSYAVKNLSLTIRPGEHIAIVGENGSGKSTLIKLLCRLYDPTEGYITLNGVDIREFRHADYMQSFSTVFQDFKLFSFSISQNISCEVNADDENVMDSINRAGIVNLVQSLPDGIFTAIYKDFDAKGYELSGGESQKIAIARALYKNSDILILDEPTSSLDPVAEVEIYSKLNSLAFEKSAIYISHRLASCKFCDVIVVLERGQIVQKGNHNELLKENDGKYHELWTAQAQHYQ